MASDIRTHTVNIDALGGSRTVLLYVPPGYEENEKRYPVLYMHDGHNLFFENTSAYGAAWGIQAALDRCFYEKGIGAIVAGIYADPLRRFDEYSPWKSAAIKKMIPELNMSGAGGTGDRYLDALVDEIIPFINGAYRTNGVNYMAGASMGAFISVYGAYKFPGMFEKIGCFSPAFWFEKEKLFTFVEEHFYADLGVYLDVGTDEGWGKQAVSATYLKDVLEFSNILKERGIKQLHMFVEEGGAHGEAAWGRRFPVFLDWLLESGNDRREDARNKIH